MCSCVLTADFGTQLLSCAPVPDELVSPSGLPVCFFLLGSGFLFGARSFAYFAVEKKFAALLVPCRAGQLPCEDAGEDFGELIYVVKIKKNAGITPKKVQETMPRFKKNWNASQNYYPEIGLAERLWFDLLPTEMNVTSML